MNWRASLRIQLEIVFPEDLVTDKPMNRAAARLTRT
jgi:hypothetical protein